MATFGIFPRTATNGLYGFSCPGGYIASMSGNTNPNEALGLTITCADGTKSASKGAVSGSPFTMTGPFTSIYATGRTGFRTTPSMVSSIGTSATNQNGPIGSAIMMNNSCPSGQYLSGINLLYNDSTSIIELQNPMCRAASLPAPSLFPNFVPTSPAMPTPITPTPAIVAVQTPTSTPTPTSIAPASTIVAIPITQTPVQSVPVILSIPKTVQAASIKAANQTPMVAPHATLSPLLILFIALIFFILCGYYAVTPVAVKGGSIQHY